MATWDITVPAGSGVGLGGAASAALSPSVPGDFDGSTINSVVVQGSPTVDNDDATKDDTIGIRWRIQTTGATAVYGDFTSDAASMCSASLAGTSLSEPIEGGVSPSPAPSTGVAADWDEVAYEANYTAEMKDDEETVSWSAFTVRVDYTPVVSGRVMSSLTGMGGGGLAGTGGLGGQHGGLAG